MQNAFNGDSADDICLSTLVKLAAGKALEPPVVRQSIHADSEPVPLLSDISGVSPFVCLAPTATVSEAITAFAKGNVNHDLNAPCTALEEEPAGRCVTCNCRVSCASPDGRRAAAGGLSTSVQGAAAP